MSKKWVAVLGLLSWGAYTLSQSSMEEERAQARRQQLAMALAFGGDRMGPGTRDLALRGLTGAAPPTVDDMVEALKKDNSAEGGRHAGCSVASAH